jgi:hypothetical protein
MTDSDVPDQTTQRLLTEDLRDQSHPSVNVNFFTIGRGNTSAFLTAVLKGNQSKKSKSSYILIGSINTENTAAFVQLYLPSGFIPAKLAPPL